MVECANRCYGKKIQPVRARGELLKKWGCAVLIRWSGSQSYDYLREEHCRQRPPKHRLLIGMAPICSVQRAWESQAGSLRALSVTVMALAFIISKMGSHCRIMNLEWHDVLPFWKSSLCCWLRPPWKGKGRKRKTPKGVIAEIQARMVA